MRALLVLISFTLLAASVALPTGADSATVDSTTISPEFHAKLVSIRPGKWLGVYRDPSYRHPLGNGRRTYYVTGRYWILARRGDWAGVSSIARHDNRLVWINLGERNARRFSIVETTRRAVVDLSARTLRVELDGRVVYRARVAVGRPSAPTPTGRTSVEAIWRPDRDLGLPAGYYGAWLMQLGLWQRHASPGFPNGGATAFHGTPNPGDRGRAVSAGCIRLEHRDLQQLRRWITVGTPVVVRR